MDFFVYIDIFQSNKNLLQSMWGTEKKYILK